jgi:hypothetical protein
VPETFTIYSQMCDSLPAEEMRRMAGAADYSTGQNQDGSRSFTYRWPGLTIRCNEMLAKQVPGHLDGFCGFVRNIYGGNPDERGKKVLDRIRHTRLVVGVVVEPARDPDGRAEEIIGMLVHNLDAFFFQPDGMYDRQPRLILGCDGSFDPEADVSGPVAELTKDRIMIELPPRAETEQPTMAQKARFGRVRERLQKKQVPMLDQPLHVDDDDVVTLREPAEVARRILVLAAVALAADENQWGRGARGFFARILGRHGREWARVQGQAKEWLDRQQLWPHVSPQEREFLTAPKFAPDPASKLLWRLEGLWVLVWALGDVELKWPTGMCDVPRLNDIVADYQAQEDFVTRAKLRPKTDILDADQEAMLLHWAIRDAWIHKRSIPADLDWSGSAKMVAATTSAAVGVVEERHHALNWLIRLGDADWDDVDTPT